LRARGGAALGLFLSLLGCGEIDGSRPFAGTAEYQPADGAYRMRLLSPPWLLVNASGEVADFAVEPSELSTDSVPPTVKLHVQPVVVGASAAAAAALAAFMAQHPSARVTIPLATIQNTAGQPGFQFSIFDPAPAAWHREAFFDGREGAFDLRFDGIVELDGLDVTSVIVGFAAKKRDGTF